MYYIKRPILLFAIKTIPWLNQIFFLLFHPEYSLPIIWDRSFSSSTFTQFGIPSLSLIHVHQFPSYDPQFRSISSSLAQFSLSFHYFIVFNINFHDTFSVSISYKESRITFVWPSKLILSNFFLHFYTLITG